jgi:hypothetical protein
MSCVRAGVYTVHGAGRNITVRLSPPYSPRSVSTFFHLAILLSGLWGTAARGKLIYMLMCKCGNGF